MLEKMMCRGHHRCWYFTSHFDYCIQRMTHGRTLAKTVKRQRDPEIVENMPIFEYATETSKPTRRVYVWGSALLGGLGISRYVRPPPGKARVDFVYRPVRLKFADENKIHDIACGNGFTIFSATARNHPFRVFGTGVNTDSQIGYQCARQGHPLVLLAAPVPIQIPFEQESTKVLRVAAGGAHSVVLTDKEGVFSLGNNAFGQCGRPVVASEIYQGSTLINKIKDLPDNVMDVVCGQDHTMFLTNDGQVYSCGWGADGQTGQGHFDSCGIPKKVLGDIVGEKIVQLSGKVDCVLALSENGDVFGWGNSEYGQLSSITKHPQINVARHLDLKSVGKVVQVASGGTMCAILNEKNQVYVWGYGLLGQGPNVVFLESPSLLPEPLFGRNEFNQDTRVESITCGINHFAALTNKKDLYMWGKNRNACLGLGHENDQFFPLRVSVPAAVNKVGCGADHTIALCRAFA